VSLFGVYQFGAAEQSTLKAATADELRVAGGLGEREAAAWAEALTFHHQWMVLSREHAAALVALRRNIITVRRRGGEKGSFLAGPFALGPL
jgi:alkylhydroperoxidase family enzyme